jgi:hypothetical protein
MKYPQIQFPKGTRIEAKNAIERMIDILIATKNSQPLKLTQRNTLGFTQDHIDKVKIVASLNPESLVFTSALPTDKILRITDEFDSGERFVRRGNTLSLTKEFYEFYKSIPIHEVVHEKDSFLYWLNSYFAKHTYTYRGRVFDKPSYTNSTNGRIEHPLTSATRAASKLKLRVKNEEVNILEFNTHPPHELSIDGDFDLIMIDYKGFAPSVLSYEFEYDFDDYPEIQGFTRDQVKILANAVRWKVKSRGLRRVRGIGPHTSTLTGKQIEAKILEAIPVYALDSKVLDKRFYELEVEILKKTLEFCDKKNIGVIPVHDGVILSNKNKQPVAEFMYQLGVDYGVRPTYKSVDKDMNIDWVDNRYKPERK